MFHFVHDVLRGEMSIQKQQEMKIAFLFIEYQQMNMFNDRTVTHAPPAVTADLWDTFSKEA